MPNETWDNAIVEAIQRKGGQEASSKEIRSEMMANPIVTDFHLQPWRSGKQLKYECWINKRLSELVRKRIIKRVSRARYSLK
jgi:hypothetical protein